MYHGYPPSWTTDDTGDTQDSIDGQYYCIERGHEWADTGMKWTYCRRCDVEGEWNMADGYTVCPRKYPGLTKRDRKS